MLDNKSSEERTRLGSRLSIERSVIYTLLKQLSAENADHFSRTSTWSTYGGRMVSVCLDLQNIIVKLESLIDEVQDLAPLYDFDERTPGNGFRSLVCISDTALLHLVSLLKIVSEQRSSFVFRLSHFCKEIESFTTVIHFLVDALPKCICNQKAIPNNSLFPPLNGSYDTFHEMLRGLEQLDATCFFGRPLGFQFAPSVHRIFHLIGVVLASYSLSWEKGHGPIGSIINTGRFLLSPEQRALRIVKVTKEADIQFCKGFWNLAELSNNMPKWFCPNMAVNELRSIDWVGPISMQTLAGDTVWIPEPSAHTGPRPVQIRVLSPVHRVGLSSHSAPNQQEASPYLLFHCHGGGYVATSSKSHETYLRMWAKLLNCTVVSVEYSLAPENPYPRPTEEVLFAYAWIINNPHLVGWTGAKLCMVGDSAGGNLIMSVNIRLIQLNILRKPDGIVPVYTPFLFQYLPSPSRVLSVMDPLLHMGVVLRCVAAYTGNYGGKMEEGTDTGHKSLQEYVDQVQKTRRIDFSGGSQSIVSLVQNMDQPENGLPSKAGSFFEDAQITQNIDDDSEDEGNDEDTRSVSSVQIDSDPLHIQLTSTVFDDQLLEYLMKHPLTKDSLTIIDENGDIVEEAEDVAKEVSIGTEESEPKRPGLLNLLGGSSASTTPNTPMETVKGIPASVSSSNVQQNTAAPLIHKRSLSQSLADTAVLAAGHAFDNLQDWFDRPSKEKQKLDRTVSLQESNQEKEAISKRKSHILEILEKSSVPRDPLISPMYADDCIIKQLPPCFFVACHLDPLLDDTIAFATKLRNAGGHVASVDLLPSVPHGFLNFTLMSPECKKGAKICLERIKEALDFVET